ncbi:MAG: 3-phosphoserine/phosphohydroxythreonine transaminase [Bacillota bacterium]|nr:3-phosphoserine/phosphohydroxythreonine transaminase [Bacillota bacterium]
MVYRVFNFYPGPATLPLPVLEQAQKEFLDYRGSGMSVMETSHRSKEFEEIITSAESLMLELLDLSDDYRVLFLQGGASLQFAMLPLNYLPAGTAADYVLTGVFAEKAIQEAGRLGKTNISASSKDNKYRNIPLNEEIKLSESPAYVHITTNNTIYGTQWKYIPECGEFPLVADMSSDILSRKIDMSKFSLVYAGAQKNLGPSGVTTVIISKTMLQKAQDNLPMILSYKVHADADSLHNTPPTFSVYMLKLVLQWVKEQGGVQAMDIFNQKKADLIYEAIDNSGGFYKGHAVREDRSTMNITFRLPNEDHEKLFVEEAKKEGLIGLKGHRSVEGIRASVYNAMPLEGCETLSRFMTEFAKKKG